MHTHMHTHMRAHACTHTHTHHTHMHARTHACKHAHTHTYTSTCKPRPTRERTQTCQLTSETRLRVLKTADQCQCVCVCLRGFEIVVVCPMPGFSLETCGLATIAMCLWSSELPNLGKGTAESRQLASVCGCRTGPVLSALKLWFPNVFGRWSPTLDLGN